MLDQGSSIQASVQFPLGPNLTEEQARQIFALGEETIIFVLMAQAKMIGQGAAAQAAGIPTPSTPSSQIAPFHKPNLTRSRKKKAGAKAGHTGHARGRPARIDRRLEHRALECPHCAGPLNRCQEVRSRYIEDIPKDVQPLVTEHIIHRDWCPRCQKKVEPVVSDALAGATIGNQLLVLTAWLHYQLGNTLSQILDVLNFHLHFTLSAGALIGMWHRLAVILEPWYEQIQEQALEAAVLYADESGWRNNGKTLWLWCFHTATVTYYQIDHCRGSPALQQFFKVEFDGTLVSDFWGAYNHVVCAQRQTCLVHLLRELEQTEKYKSPGPHWPAFAKKLRRLIGDAIRLVLRREQLKPEAYQSLRDRLFKRLEQLIQSPWEDRHAKRLVKRLRRHQQDLFTFVDHPEVPYHNNAAERAIRPAVILGKNSYGNRSDRGTQTQEILMSVLRTLKQHGHHPIKTLGQALEAYLKSGSLPPLPDPVSPSD